MDARDIPYQRLSIYQTKARLYIVGYCKLRGTAALLKISKQEPTQLDVAEVVGSYSLDEIRAMLSQIHMANAHLGGLQLVTHCCGIIGCFRFTETYYLLLVTRKAHVGSLCGGHKVYTVAATALVPLHPGYQQTAAAAGQPSGAAEKRYVKLLMGMDLTKHFYFSFTYNLAHTVQRNCRVSQQRAESQLAQMQTGSSSPPVLPPGVSPSSSSVTSSSVYDSMFTWNAYLTSALRRALSGNSRWTVPLIHGFWEQRRLSIYGRPLTLTLIARRSRHFAGTRYRKRGINDRGKVANEVETEQVVDVGLDYRTRTPLMSSVVQVRGSVPLFWSQQLTALSPKPEIILQQFDPLYEVTEAHFSDLESRYGAPAVVLNLLKSKERRPREVLLRRELAAAIAQLNAQRGRGRMHIVYIPWDFAKHAKQSGANLLNEIAAITRLGLDMTGLFVHNPSAPAAPTTRMFSSGGAPTMPTAVSSPFLSYAGNRPSARTAVTALRRTTGDCGSTAHLAAAAEVAATAIKARSAAAAATTMPSAIIPSRSGIASPTGRPASLDLYSPTRHTSTAFTHAAANAAVAASRRGSGGGGGLGAVQWQSGVLRTNCIDCLDRTNVAQYAFGLVAFGRQLYKLGLHDVRDIDADSSAAFTLMALYEAMGHVLSLQYGGSEAHTIFFQRKKGEWEAATQSKDLVTSIKRLYSNTYTDAEKQDAINLFLGNFVPQPKQPHLWQLDTDQYLHSETTIKQPPQPPQPPMQWSTPSTRPSSFALLSTAAAAAAAEHPLSPTLPVSWCPGEGPSGALVKPVEEPHAVLTTRSFSQQPSPLSHRSPQSQLAVAQVSTDWTTMATVVAAAAALGAAQHSGDVLPQPSVAASGRLSAAATAAAKFPGLPPECTPLPLELSSDDDDDARSRSYHEPGVQDSGGGGGGGGATYASAAIPFHKAPSSGGFLSSMLPSLSRGGGGGGSSSGGSGSPGLFERVVTSLLQPGGAGAAARSAAAGVAGGDVAGGAINRPGRLLVSFDQALARPPNQVCPILLHGEEDKQGRWAAVQSAFSFFWTSNAGGGAGDGTLGPRNNYQLDDAPRPQPRSSQTALHARTSTTLSPIPSGVQTPLSPAASGLPSMPFSPEASRHGGGIYRTLTAGTDGGFSFMSDASPRSPLSGIGGTVAATAAAAGTGLETAGLSGPSLWSLRQVLESMVDADHADQQQRGRDIGCRTVAATIPALCGVMGGYVGASGEEGEGGGGGDCDEDDVAYYYSVGDGEAAAAAAAGQMDGGIGGLRHANVRTSVTAMFSGGLLSSNAPSPGTWGTSTAGGKQPYTVANIAASSSAVAGGGIPVLNDFIEVTGGASTRNADWRSLGEGHTLDPATRRRAAAEAAARAREEERQRKLLTADLEVNDLLDLGLEDLSLHWELQPWWALEPRPLYLPRPYEPHPARLINVMPPHKLDDKHRWPNKEQQKEEEFEQQQQQQQQQQRQQDRDGNPSNALADLICLDSAIHGLGEVTSYSEAAVAGAAVAEAEVAAVSQYLALYEPAPVHVLQQRQQMEQMAFLHFDVAEAHARSKFGDFLAAISQPYGLYGEERRRDIAMYDMLCYIEAQ